MTETGAINEECGPVLLALARASIASAFGRSDSADRSAPWLRAKGSCFVTLTLGQKLRGCVGNIEARRPLLDEVTAVARAAAFNDPRFPPLGADELESTRIEVSLLSALEPLPAGSEDEVGSGHMSMGSCLNGGDIVGLFCRRSGPLCPIPETSFVSSS